MDSGVVVSYMLTAAIATLLTSLFSSALLNPRPALHKCFFPSPSSDCSDLYFFISVLTYRHLCRLAHSWLSANRQRCITQIKNGVQYLELFILS